jgi:hypothetical protein
MKKLRYRISPSGWYIPQYQSTDTNWVDFKVSHLGNEMSLLHRVARDLGEPKSFGHIIYHCIPSKGENRDNMSLIFKDDVRASAFLGAAKAYFGERTKEIDL